MASFPITQRCTSPAFLITRRLRRAVLQRDTGSRSKGACLEGGGLQANRFCRVIGPRGRCEALPRPLYG